THSDDLMSAYRTNPSASIFTPATSMSPPHTWPSRLSRLINTSVGSEIVFIWTSWCPLDNTRLPFCMPLLQSHLSPMIDCMACNRQQLFLHPQLLFIMHAPCQLGSVGIYPQTLIV